MEGLHEAPQDVVYVSSDPSGEVVTEGPHSSAAEFRKERKFREWSPTDLKAAVSHVLTKGWTVFKASRAFGIPYNTLKRRCKKGDRGSQPETSLDAQSSEPEKSDPQPPSDPSAGQSFDPLSTAFYAVIKGSEGTSSTAEGASTLWTGQQEGAEPCNVHIVPVERVTYATIVPNTQAVDSAGATSYYTLVPSQGAQVVSSVSRPTVVSLTAASSATTASEGATAIPAPPDSKVSYVTLPVADASVTTQETVPSSGDATEAPKLPPAEVSEVHGLSSDGGKVDHGSPRVRATCRRIRPKPYEVVIIPHQRGGRVKAQRVVTDPALALVNVEKARLAVEKERLAVEKERLKVECERLAVEKERLSLEKVQVAFPEVIVENRVES